MNVRELGIQIAQEQVQAACQATGTAIDEALFTELADRLYAFICKVKALEFGTEYYKALLGQVDQVLGGDQEANFANVPGKVMQLARAHHDMAAYKTRLEAQLAAVAQPPPDNPHLPAEYRDRLEGPA